MPRFRETIPVDDYVFDVLMRDIVGHDKQPAAYLVYLWLYGQTARLRWKPVAISLRGIAEQTGLSKSAVQTALALLRRRELIETSSAHPTATPEHQVLRHWRNDRPRVSARRPEFRSSRGKDHSAESSRARH